MTDSSSVRTAHPTEDRQKTLSEILRLVWEQTQAMKAPLVSVQAVEKRAAQIDKLVKRIATENLSSHAG